MSKVKDYGPAHDEQAQDPSDRNPGDLADAARLGLKRRETPADTRSKEPLVDRSPYLVQRLLHANDENLFNHVKFHLVKRHIDALDLAQPRLLDIGCG
ncbi:MAG: hypothetical protein AAF499_04470, partial [Pseudomonadota bacterium]